MCILNATEVKGKMDLGRSDLMKGLKFGKLFNTLISDQDKSLY